MERSTRQLYGFQWFEHRILSILTFMVGYVKSVPRPAVRWQSVSDDCMVWWTYERGWSLKSPHTIMLRPWWTLMYAYTASACGERSADEAFTFLTMRFAAGIISLIGICMCFMLSMTSLSA